MRTSDIQTQEAIINGGFETGDFTGWITSTTGTAQIRNDGNEGHVHTGTYGCQLVWQDWLGFTNPTIIIQEFNDKDIFVDEYFELSFWAKSGVYNIFIDFKFDDLTTVRINCLTSDSWHFFRNTYEEFPMGKKLISISFESFTIIATSISAAIDDISLKYNPYLKNAVKNGHFESNFDYWNSGESSISNQERLGVITKVCRLTKDVIHQNAPTTYEPTSISQSFSTIIPSMKMKTFRFFAVIPSETSLRTTIFYQNLEPSIYTFNSASGWNEYQINNLYVDTITGIKFERIGLTIYPNQYYTYVDCISMVYEDDTDDPIILSSPLNPVKFDEDSGIQELKWSATDRNPGDFLIESNGQWIHSGYWLNYEIISINIDTSHLSDNNYIVTFWDTFGNDAGGTWNVQVLDRKKPTLNSPADIIVELGDISKNIKWLPYDKHNSDYKIYINNILNKEGLWDNGDEIVMQIDASSIGNFNYRIEVFDSSGNMQYDEVNVIVQDTLPPRLEFLGLGTNMILNGDFETGTLEYWQTGPNIAVQTHNNPPNHTGQYQCFLTPNGQADQSYIEQELSSILNIITTEELYFSFFAHLGGSADTIKITITYTDKTISEQTYIKQYYPDECISFSNFEPNKIIEKIRIETIGEASIYTYIDNIRLYYLDYSLVGESLIILEEGYDYDIMAWKLFEKNPDYYQIDSNSSYHEIAGCFKDSQIDISIENLSIGDYKYTIQVRDLEDFTNKISTTLKIVSANPPTNLYADLNFTSQQNFMEYGSQGNEFIARANDLNPDTYSIWRIDANEGWYFQFVESGIWYSGEDIRYNLDHLPIGHYFYRIFFVDKRGFNVSIAPSIFDVIDSTNPIVINSPDNITYQLGCQENYFLNWTLFDLGPDIYNLYVNDNLLQTSNWNSYYPLEFNVSYLGVGLYEYKIEIYDKSGNSYIESKWVNVIDTINPIIISAPTNHTFELDNFESYSLIWTVNDLDPYIYNVYIDDILNHSYSWIKDIPIGIILFDLDIAVYNYTVESIDKSGNAVTNSVFITIVDNISPKLQLEPNDQIIQSGENAIIEWIFNDKSALNYVIYINGTQYTQDNWKDSEVILLKLNDLNIGKYNITIQCFDKQGNSSIDSVLIDVIAHKESIISFGIYFFAIMIAGFIGLVLHTKKRL